MKQKTVLITGAAGGLGSELSVQLAREGANLLLLDRNSRGLDQLSDRICADGQDEPGVCPLDLSRMGSLELRGLQDILRAEYGGLDVLIHCAISFDGLQPMDQITPAQWQECMRVNVEAAWLLIVCCLPMLKSSGGRIVFVQDDDTHLRSAYWGAYGVSKAALKSLGEILGQELEGTEMAVINFEPGPMRTALRASAFLAENPDRVQPPGKAAATLIKAIRNSYIPGFER